MGLGVVCQWMEKRTLKNGRVETFNSMNERALRLCSWSDGSYTDKHVVGTYLNNVQNLADRALVIREHVSCFRISSTLLPLADRVDRSLWDNNELKQVLALAGARFREKGVRLTMHPGQFCVLSSDSHDVRKNAISDLEIHAWIFDSMGMPCSPHSAINIHGGKSDRLDRLIASVTDLPDNIRKRLTLENDESAYSVLDLFGVSQKTGVPIVVDSHHHTFNDGDLTLHEALTAAAETWPSGIRPLQHLSNTEPELKSGSFLERRKHSYLIHEIPETQLQFILDDAADVEVEAKGKNIAVQAMTKRFSVRSRNDKATW